jgi:hypothetical protein
MQSDLHVNVPLTNVSLAWFQDKKKYIADRVFPKVPVQSQSNIFWKYGKSDWLKTDVRKRAPGTESAGVGWTMDTDTYRADPYAVHKDVNDQERANADSNFNVDSDATKFVTNQLLLKRDIDWSARFFIPTPWTTQRTGVSGTPGSNEFKQWNDDASDPVGYVDSLMVNFEELTGERPNKLVMGAKVLPALKNHPDILDRIKYTQRGVVTTDLLAGLFGVDEIIIPRAINATGPDKGDAASSDAAATYAFVHNPKACLLVYTPDSPSLQTPAAGYTFTWTNYVAGNGEGIRIKKFRMEHLESDRIEGTMTYDMKVVSGDLGIFLSSVVA